MGSKLNLYGTGNAGCEEICKDVQRLESLPDGWRYIDGAMTAPRGWRWANNGKSRFGKGKEYRHALVRVKGVE